MRDTIKKVLREYFSVKDEIINKILDDKVSKKIPLTPYEKWFLSNHDNIDASDLKDKLDLSFSELISKLSYLLSKGFSIKSFIPTRMGMIKQVKNGKIYISLMTSGKIEELYYDEAWVNMRFDLRFVDGLWWLTDRDIDDEHDEEIGGIV